MSLSLYSDSHFIVKQDGPVYAEAVRRAQQGWPVFPCRLDKSPHTRHGFKSASCDERVIDKWWKHWPEASAGLATGRPSRVLVSDIDPRNGGSWDALERLTGCLPTTPIAETGGGGLHVYFAMPSGMDVRSGTNKLGPGLDVKASGGYVILPPSGHVSGSRYRWRVSPDDVPLAPLPGALAALLAVPLPNLGNEKEEAGTALLDDGTAIAPYQLHVAEYWLARALARAEAGTRNETGLWLACQLRDRGCSYSHALDVMSRYAAHVGNLSDHAYTVAEANASARQAYSRVARVPSVFLPAPDGAESYTPYAQSGTKIDGDIWDSLESSSLAADTLVYPAVTPKGRGRPASPRLHAQYAAMHDAMVLAFDVAPSAVTLRKWVSWLGKAGHSHDAASVVVATVRYCRDHAAGDVQYPIGYVQRSLCQRLGIPYRTKADGVEATKKKPPRTVNASPSIPDDATTPQDQGPPDNPPKGPGIAMLFSPDEVRQRFLERQEEAAQLAALRQRLAG